MILSELDKGKYLRGLLVLSKKDRQLTMEEKNIVKEVGSYLGYDAEFIQESIQNILSNKYVKDEPVVFSSEEAAKHFINDGLKLSFCDTENPVEELKYITKVAELNKIDSKWFSSEISRHAKHSKIN
ncbi:MAG: hypothetical protein C4539_00430 [Ignavibacteriales bacterium]|nr:MAG: hypothetical protein C4539_00430 [Ignavibacteriales bacterium]